MKKLFFAAFAAFVMVSMGNVFANGNQTAVGFAGADDTTTVDTAVQAGELAEALIETPVDTTLNDSTDANETAMMFNCTLGNDSTDNNDTAMMFNCTLGNDSTDTDTTATAAPNVA